MVAKIRSILVCNTLININMAWDDDYCNDDKVIGWHNDYQKGKAQKSQIKEQLMSIAWHPSKWWDWCVPEDEKTETEILLWA